jgi:hypothetical protein
MHFYLMLLEKVIIPYMISTDNSISGPAALFGEKVGAQPQTPGEGQQPFTIPLLLLSLMFEWMAVHIENIIA